MKITKTMRWGEHTLTLETGEVARQADGAVWVTLGETQLLVTAVVKKNGAENNSFFPLTVHYQEKYFAAGKIPGGFGRREGRPSEQETLISRLIDRPIRPLFPKAFRHEIQIVATVFSLDPAVPSDIVALIGASAALSLAGVPFEGPIGAARVGYQEGVYLLNPSQQALKTSTLDLVVAGTQDAVLMVESEANELTESVMLGAMMFGHEMMRPVIELIAALAKDAQKPQMVWQAPELTSALEARIAQLAQSELEKAYSIKEKLARYTQLDQIKAHLIETLTQEDDTYTAELIALGFSRLEKQTVRQRILSGEPRIDGRDCETVRPITIRPTFLNRAHGSVLFTRGETQAIVAVTLGNDRDAQILDNLTGETRDRFMLHYNFPHYSVGETGMMGSPKRREIGHGRLAKRGLMAVLPEAPSFPYVLRVVSEITESNGSSSMATVCGASLALMDAGVPLRAPVAGVAMGLIKESDKFTVLTDILGDEDEWGDMDFKVAGTSKGITALQMDMKITGITQPILEQALDQAKRGRLHILGVMNQALPAPRTELSLHAPRIASMKVPEDKIRNVIGKGGAVIKGLIERTGAQIDIDDTGMIQLFSPNADALLEAERQIKALVAEVEVGQSYDGRVIKIVEFGAFINLLPGKDGLLHISQICTDRTQKVDAILAEGQPITVFVAGVDKQGRVKLEWPAGPVGAVGAESKAQSQG